METEERQGGYKRQTAGAKAQVGESQPLRVFLFCFFGGREVVLILDPESKACHVCLLEYRGTRIIGNIFNLTRIIENDHCAMRAASKLIHESCISLMKGSYNHDQLTAQHHHNCKDSIQFYQKVKQRPLVGHLCMTRR